jgi:hypothetical protein
VKNLDSHIKGRTETEGVWRQEDEVNTENKRQRKYQEAGDCTIRKQNVKQFNLSPYRQFQLPARKSRLAML